MLLNDLSSNIQLKWAQEVRYSPMPAQKHLAVFAVVIDKLRTLQTLVMGSQKIKNTDK